MNTRTTLLHTFFTQYANRFNAALKEETPDINETAGAFSDCFVAASPAGVRCGNNDETFKTAMSGGYAFYQSIGVKAMDIVAIETTILDTFHEMTKVKWKCRFVKKDNSAGSIEFENFYFTQTRENKPKIFAYITGDEQAVLKENGLI